jgi:hypothetical protein
VGLRRRVREKQKRNKRRKLLAGYRPYTIKSKRRNTEIRKKQVIQAYILIEEFTRRTHVLAYRKRRKELVNIMGGYRFSISLYGCMNSNLIVYIYRMKRRSKIKETLILRSVQAVKIHWRNPRVNLFVSQYSTVAEFCGSCSFPRNAVRIHRVAICQLYE